MSWRRWGFKRLLGLLINAGGLLVLVNEALSLTVR
jgi:hypothetical protein